MLTKPETGDNGKPQSSPRLTADDGMMGRTFGGEGDFEGMESIKGNTHPSPDFMASSSMAKRSSGDHGHAQGLENFTVGSPTSPGSLMFAMEGQAPALQLPTAAIPSLSVSSDDSVPTSVVENDISRPYEIPISANVLEGVSSSLPNPSLIGTPVKRPGFYRNSTSQSLTTTLSSLRRNFGGGSSTIFSHKRSDSLSANVSGRTSGVTSPVLSGHSRNSSGFFKSGSRTPTVPNSPALQAMMKSKAVPDLASVNRALREIELEPTEEQPKKKTFGFGKWHATLHKFWLLTR